MAIVSSGQMTISDLNDAKQLVMYIGASQSRTVLFNGATTYTPLYSSTNQVLTPQLFVAGTTTDVAGSATSTKWYYQINGTGSITEITSTGTDYTLTGTNFKTLTLKTNLLTVNQSITYICEMTYTDVATGFIMTAKSEIEIVKITNGVDSITAVLNNDTHVFPADLNGTVSNFTNANTTMTIYKGSTDDSANWTYVQTRVGAGLTVTEATTSRTATVTAIGAGTDTATITFVATRTGGGYPTITKVFTMAKSKTGLTGADPTTYWMTTSADVVQKSATGVLSPTSVTATGFKQTGAGAPISDASFKFVTDTSTDGSTFTNNVGSPTGAVASTSYSVGAVKAFRFRMYRSADTPTVSNFVDEQIVVVVNDGVSYIYNNVWTPDGNAIKNSTGTLRIESDVYDGASQVTPTAFKWYIQDSTATTSLGGDADGGNGWRLDVTPTAPTTAPTLGSGVGGTLTGATYYVRYTWVSATGETVANTTEANRAVTANNTLTVQVPAFPVGVQSANIYVGTATGTANLKYQGEITATGGTLTINAPISTSNAIAPVAYTGATGNTTAIITVPASAITSAVSFKCVATYNSLKFAGVATVVDLSDPIVVRIEGVSVFKNGVGDVTMKAVLLQTGAEIDAGGTLYNYTWSIYDATNVKSAFNKTGKQITVNADDIDVRGNLVCVVSTK